MGTFLKKHWPLFALFLAIGVIMFQIQSCDSRNDKDIAGMMADRVVTRLRARVTALDAKYAALNAEKDGELVVMQAQWGVDRAKAAAWRKRSEEAQAKVTTLEGCNALLDDCQANAEFFDGILDARTQGLVRWSNERVALKDAELTERRALDSTNIDTIGKLTKRVAMLELWKRRKLVIGPQAGYGPGGMYVGVGATFEIFRIKAPGLH